MSFIPNPNRLPVVGSDSTNGGQTAPHYPGVNAPPVASAARVGLAPSAVMGAGGSVPIAGLGTAPTRTQPRLYLPKKTLVPRSFASFRDSLVRLMNISNSATLRNTFRRLDPDDKSWLTKFKLKKLFPEELRHLGESLEALNTWLSVGEEAKLTPKVLMSRVMVDESKDARDLVRLLGEWGERVQEQNRILKLTLMEMDQYLLELPALVQQGRAYAPSRMNIAANTRAGSTRASRAGSPVRRAHSPRVPRAGSPLRASSPLRGHAGGGGGGPSSPIPSERGFSRASSHLSMPDTELSEDESMLAPTPPPDPGQPGGAGGAGRGGMMEPGDFASLVRKVQSVKKSDVDWALLKTNQSVFVQERRRIFQSLDHLMAHYLCTLISIIIALSLAEISKDKAAYTHFMNEGQLLASDLIRSCLPLVERALSFEPQLFSLNIYQQSTRGLHKDKTKLSFAHVVYKVRLIDHIFASMDIFLFPYSIHCHDDGIKAIILSNLDSTICMTGSYDMLIKVWDTRSKRCHGQFAGHRSIVTCLKFSGDDSFFISSSSDHTVRIWESKTAECIRTLRGHKDAVLCCDLSKDDQLVASASMDVTVRLWQVSTGECLRLMKGHTKWVKLVRFSPSNTHVLSAGLDKKIMIWDLSVSADEEGKTPAESIENAHSDYICDMDVAEPDVLITCSRDYHVKLWSISGCNLIREHNDLPGQMSCCVFSADGKFYACSSYDNNIVVFRKSDGQLLRKLKVHNDGILSIRFGKGSQVMLCGTSSGKLQLLPM